MFFSAFLFAQTEIRTHEVYFETDKFDVPPTEHYRLLLFMSEIESMDIKKVSIYGFTDDRGSDSYNLVLFILLKSIFNLDLINSTILIPEVKNLTHSSLL